MASTGRGAIIGLRFIHLISPLFFLYIYISALEKLQSEWMSGFGCVRGNLLDNISGSGANNLMGTYREPTFCYDEVGKDCEAPLCPYGDL